jgi:uncharacterized protein (DUF488 family)
MKKAKLFTIGYEGRDINNLVSNLKKFNITRLIDVREIPISRKKGFSKSQLMETLESADIEYVHIKQLGSPSSLRHQLEDDHDYAKFFSAYTNYLEAKHDLLMQLNDEISDKTSCLMCFERLQQHCHRSIVANKLKEYNKNNLEIIHI